jgi:hypothetical protein
LTQRPTRSKNHLARTAFGSLVGVFLTAALLASCSALDPTTGTPVWSEDVPDADTPDGDDAGQQEDLDPGAVHFGRDIRPLMDRPGKGDPSGRGCKSCHYHTEASHIGTDLGGLDLTTLGSLRLGGGSSGRRIVVAGKPAESVIVQALRGQYPYANRMPKNGNPYWSEAEIDLIEQWISEGAKGADDE